MRQSLIDDFPLSPLGRICRLRSAVGERGSGAEGGKARIAHRSRSATAAAQPQTEAPPLLRLRRVCRSRRARGLRRGTGVVEREKGPTGSLWSVAIRAMVTAVKAFDIG
jgi:hypothetical protein